MASRYYLVIGTAPDALVAEHFDVADPGGALWIRVKRRTPRATVADAVIWRDAAGVRHEAVQFRTADDELGAAAALRREQPRVAEYWRVFETALRRVSTERDE